MSSLELLYYLLQLHIVYGWLAGSIYQTTSRYMGCVPVDLAIEFTRRLC